MTDSTDTTSRSRAGRSAADLDAAPVPPQTPSADTTATEITSVDTAEAASAAETGAAVNGANAAQPTASEADRDEVLEALKDVVDPELGINVVDLGLVYDVILDRGDHGTTATIDMTLTSAACPLTDMIEDQVNAALVGVGGNTGMVDDARINWVWMPPWDITRITDDGREQLRSLGFSV